jgi:hypothetical protein
MEAVTRCHLLIYSEIIINAALIRAFNKHLRFKIVCCLEHILNNKDGSLDIDNNKVENRIRLLALGRKNFLFMGSPAGAKTGATFYSLIATCIENSIQPYEYLCTMLNQIPLCKEEKDYLALLPQNIILN